MIKQNSIDRDLIAEPPARKLRIFAFDPGVSSAFDQADVGEVLLEVRWENGLRRGPIGEYLEVVDVDHGSGAYYKPVDLDHERVLGQNGLTPSEGNPQFHQQMVYAVAMSTINHFEQALGRVALWSSHLEINQSWVPGQAPGNVAQGAGQQPAPGTTLTEDRRSRDRFVRRLRIYPHAFRGQNAYYSPPKKALLFGYFPVVAASNGNVPGTTVFTCLSHDIVAHETTHALLDGVHPRFNIPFNQDVLAFHEAFADIVAMLQKFAYPNVLRRIIARTRGNLASDNLLGQIAQQFGRATGRGNALRDAIGFEDADGKWHMHKPDPRRLARAKEPHERGAILVAAVFGAFLKVYRARTADLYRLASNGTGVMAEGDIHPDLTNRLAEEARFSARYVLLMCIRATDYCPPVGITFGDYLRAIVTADVDLNPDDTDGYRLALIESFRQWGIYPEGVRSVSSEALLWPDLKSGKIQLTDHQRSLFEEFFERLPRLSSRKRNSLALTDWSLDSDRYAAWESAKDSAELFWNWLTDERGQEIASLLGIVLDANAAATIYRSERTKKPALEVHAVRPIMRRSARGAIVRHLVVEIMQRRRGYFDRRKQVMMDLYDPDKFPADDKGDFTFRAGCTFLYDPDKHRVLRVIRTSGARGEPTELLHGTIADNEQLERVRTFLSGAGLARPNAFDGPHSVMKNPEFFAALHRFEEGHDV